MQLKVIVSGNGSPFKGRGVLIGFQYIFGLKCLQSTVHTAYKWLPDDC